ncbi:stage V sporulation protein D (sporulation-specific penicillin-binding protein) [Sedimentibacter acidaminivorans]|uniref:Stage V sporulation protein D (Sporulation-specific penicillin-binding protein) n=1 Tax=Sedimentibacter acidaminivorans TaxID=913099 RepID=A0ABS4G927_9FIRM|nr:penicillin-binding transpeptidase domain-containing protein [Sedimentibacter acidaminivorans]MBP1924183.1 stage V sporulation protein D (sporulation-specific penicillin-binding protein) [Sedimentibacter acidaminivorans]
MRRRKERGSTDLRNKKRMLVFLVCFFLTTVALIIRLGYIQLIKGNEYKKAAMENWARDITISAKRGTIYDSRGKKLAVSVNSNTVTCFPADVKKGSKLIEAESSSSKGGFITSILRGINKSFFNQEESSNKEEVAKNIKTPEQIAESLASILEMNYDEILKKITSNTSYVILKKWITDEQAAQIREAELSGINIIEDNKRVYPYGSFAPYVLGFTNVDQDGLYGVEATYNEYLTGIPGRMVVNTDANGRELPFGYNEYYESQDGLGVVLTIDEVIQHFAESAAEKVKSDYNAKRATIVVMDPNNGDVLALASKPDYDPNDPKIPTDKDLQEQWKSLSGKELQESWFDMWRNPAVNDIYEPGSTFKLLTVATALEENAATLESTYFCDGYVKQIPGENIKCWRYYNPHGKQTLSEALQHSCNDALAQIGLDIGKDPFYKYLRSFGLEEVSGIKLNGEAPGLVKHPENMKDVDVVTQAFGQGVTLTPIQLVTAVSALSNGGNLLEPRIVKQLIDEDGNVVENFDTVVRRKVVSEQTSKTMLQLMRESAEAGTKQAYRMGYRIGGKSGTAQKVINGTYPDGKFISSFVGVAPVDDPKAVVLVMVDEPDRNIGYYGSIVAGPVAADLLENIMKYYDVEPVYTEEELSGVDAQTVEVPNLLGLTIAEATKKLIKANLTSNITIEIEADKIVKSQFPKAGEKVVKNSVITLILN